MIYLKNVFIVIKFVCLFIQNPNVINFFFIFFFQFSTKLSTFYSTNDAFLVNFIFAKHTTKVSPQNENFISKNCCYASFIPSLNENSIGSVGEKMREYILSSSYITFSVYIWLGGDEHTILLVYIGNG